MGNSIHNSQGYSLVSLMVGSAISMIVFGVFGQFLLNQSRQMAFMQTKLEVLQAQSTVAQMLGDTSVCSCIFDMSAPGNPYRGQNGGQGIVVNATALENGIPISDFVLVGQDLGTGVCDFAPNNTISLAKVGEPYRGSVGNVIVNDMRFGNIQFVNDVTPQTKRYRATLFIEIVKERDRTLKMPRMEADLNFFTDAAGVAKGCDIGDEVSQYNQQQQQAYRNQEDQFSAGIAGQLNTAQTQIPAYAANQLGQTQDILDQLVSAQVSAATAHPDQDDFDAIWAEFLVYINSLRAQGYH